MVEEVGERAAIRRETERKTILAGSTLEVKPICEEEKFRLIIQM